MLGAKMVFGAIVSRWNEEFLNTEKEKLNTSWTFKKQNSRNLFIWLFIKLTQFGWAVDHGTSVMYIQPQVRRVKFETAFVTKSLGLWSKSRGEVCLYGIWTTKTASIDHYFIFHIYSTVWTETCFPIFSFERKKGELTKYVTVYFYLKLMLFLPYEIIS